MATAEIVIGLRWKWESGEGDNCCNCNDPAFLRELRFYAVINGKEERQNLVLCSSCGEALKLESEG